LLPHLFLSLCLLLLHFFTQAINLLELAMKMKVRNHHLPPLLINRF